MQQFVPRHSNRFTVHSSVRLLVRLHAFGVTSGEWFELKPRPFTNRQPIQAGKFKTSHAHKRCYGMIGQHVVICFLYSNILSALRSANNEFKCHILIFLVPPRPVCLLTNRLVQDMTWSHSDMAWDRDRDR